MIKINILQVNTFNKFLINFEEYFPNVNLFSEFIYNIINNLLNEYTNYINKNLNNVNIHKLIYIKIQNILPRKISKFVLNNYEIDNDLENLLKQIIKYNFNFENYDYNNKILTYINNFIFSLKQNNLEYIKSNYNFDNIFNKEKNFILDNMNKNAKNILKGRIEDLQKITLDNKITNIKQFIKYIKNHKEQFVQLYGKEIIGIIMPYKICKQYNYTMQETRLFVSYLFKTLNIIDYIINAIKSLNQDQLFSKFIGDPWEFINFKDNTSNKNIVYSTRSPYDFSADRSGPLVIIENEVLRGNNDDLPHHNDILRKFKKEHEIEDDSEAAYNQGYEEYNNVGVGSEFDNIALLEFIQGNVDIIKQALIRKGFKKIYINNQSAWTSKEYKRIAKRHLKFYN